jgi:phosphoglycerate dehydrogenase-like enzyme
VKVLILDDYIGVAQQSARWDTLPAESELRILREPVSSEDERAKVFAPYEVIVAMRERTPFPSSLIEALPNLRLLVTTGTRNASIDLEACRRRGVVVCSAPGSRTSSAPAELTWALILGLMKRVPMEHQSVLRGRWQTGTTQQVSGKCLGVVGLGNLGSQVARIGLAFGMQVQAWSPNLTAQKAARAGVSLVDKATLFSTADVVTLHLVLGPATADIVQRADLQAMKRSAIFINTSRADLVEAGALEQALAAGWISGAGLDVYRTEPLSPGDPLCRYGNVILSPHLGYVTPENMEAFYGNALAAILAWDKGTPIRVLGGDPEQ